MIHFTEFDKLYQIDGLGANSTVVCIDTDVSYWHMYLTNIVYILNRGKADTSFDPKKVKSKVSSNGNTRVREYSTACYPNVRLVENYFSQEDDLVLYLARAHVKDFE